jgi:uncharacterized membrane protein
MIPLWVLITALGVLAIWGATMIVRRSGQASRPERPLEILKRRLAAGEIDSDEFEALKRSLESV